MNTFTPEEDRLIRELSQGNPRASKIILGLISHYRSTDPLYWLRDQGFYGHRIIAVFEQSSGDYVIMRWRILGRSAAKKTS